MDAYRKFSGLNGSNQGLEVRAGFQFLFIEGLQFFNWKNSNQIIKESVDPNTPACAMLWLIWRQANDVMDCIDDCINVNTKITDEFHQLENSNSATI
jgi:hypothetical protein